MMNDATNASLTDIATRFLASLSEAKQKESQPEVLKFIRWCGRDRAITGLTSREVEQFAGDLGTAPSASKTATHVRAFLAFAHKQGATKLNLTTSFKLKKMSGSSQPASDRKRTVTHFTREGYEKLQAELEGLKSRRGEAAREIHRAAADKDFRENAPLEAAREQQGQLESKIRHIQAILNSAEVLEKEPSPEELVKTALGSSVSIKDLSNGDELTCTLVAQNEANLAQGKLSVASPVGRALLGRRRGEEVEVKVPAGTIRYRIQGINT